MTARLQVCLDIGSHQHHVALGSNDKGIAEVFTISHDRQGMQMLFERIECINGQRKLPVLVAMESFNGHARPLDRAVLAKGYQLFNVNNHKLARFKEIFPAAAKTDAIDVKKMFELMTLQTQNAIASDVLQEVHCLNESHEKLKRLCRRRKQLVEEKIVLLNRLWSDLQAVAPGLVLISKRMGNLWFLRFLLACDNYHKLLQFSTEELRAIPGIGRHYCHLIQGWQQSAY